MRYRIYLRVLSICFLATGCFQSEAQAGDRSLCLGKTDQSKPSSKGELPRIDSNGRDEIISKISMPSIGPEKPELFFYRLIINYIPLFIIFCEIHSL
jgi:hypothetical protein